MSGEQPEKLSIDQIVRDDTFVDPKVAAARMTPISKLKIGDRFRTTTSLDTIELTVSGKQNDYGEIPCKDDKGKIHNMKAWKHVRKL
jgi:hypothetical protein